MNCTKKKMERRGRTGLPQGFLQPPPQGSIACPWPPPQMAASPPSQALALPRTSTRGWGPSAISKAGFLFAIGWVGSSRTVSAVRSAQLRGEAASCPPAAPGRSSDPAHLSRPVLLAPPAPAAWPLHRDGPCLPADLTRCRSLPPQLRAHRVSPASR